MTATETSPINTVSKRFFAIVLSIAVAFPALWIFVVPRIRPHTFTGSVIQSTNPAPRVDLLATTGAPVSLDDFKDKVVVMYFGYTFCPDVCPTTLNKLDDALDQLGDRADEVQVIMVSVDPLRDTTETLSQYLGFFDPRFIGLTGSEEEIAAVATVYGVYFQAREGTENTGYLVDHTATVMVVDRDGYLKLVMPPDATADQIADDLSFLL